jgi:hypothetical protein
MALSTVKKAFTSKPSYLSDPNAAMLAEMCRKATAKDAFQPDANVKQLVRLCSLSHGCGYAHVLARVPSRGSLTSWELAARLLSDLVLSMRWNASLSEFTHS